MLGIKTHFVIKRRLHQGQMVTAWESISFVPESKVLGTPALSWIQRGWNVTCPYLLPNGSEGCRSWATIKAFINVQGDPTADLGERGLKLVRVMAAGLDETGKRAEQTFENMLMFEAANKRRRLT